MVAGLSLRLIVLGILAGVGAYLAQSLPRSSDRSTGTIWEAALRAFSPVAPFFNSLAHDHRQPAPPFDALTPSRQQREMDKAAAAAERVARAAVVRQASSEAQLTAQHRMPVYFVSHGSPMTMFEPESKPARAWARMGEDVRERIRPKAIVFVSAHWEGERDAVLVTDQATNDLTYDYYGFPPEYCACASSFMWVCVGTSLARVHAYCCWISFAHAPRRQGNLRVARLADAVSTRARAAPRERHHRPTGPARPRPRRLRPAAVHVSRRKDRHPDRAGLALRV